MKLLLDNNLSYKLITRLADIYPHSAHVMDIGLDNSDDALIWHHAHDHGFTIVTKDSDFNDLVLLNGAPPKIIWLKIGNCRISDIERLLRQNLDRIEAFHEWPKGRVLEIS